MGLGARMARRVVSDDGAIASWYMVPGLETPAPADRSSASMGDKVDLLELRGVVLGFHKDRPLLPAVHFTVRKGDVVGILGPNGAGKSTLLRTTLGLQRPLGGTLAYPLG